MRKARLGLQNIEREAERLKTLLPLRPLYDSGWVLSAAGGTQTFTHNLGHLPLLWSLMAAKDANGADPVPMLVGRFSSAGVWLGFEESDLSTTQFVISIFSGGYALHNVTWYQRGTHYIRLLIWAVEE